MIKRLMIKDYRLTFTFAHVGKVIGVNSHGRDDLHIIMWDFDDITLKEVTYHLKKIQWQYSLSDIYLLKTKEPDNYIAYCFTLRPWREVVAIVVRTEGVDWQFIRFGVYRIHHVHLRRSLSTHLVSIEWSRLLR